MIRRASSTLCHLRTRRTIQRHLLIVVITIMLLPKSMLLRARAYGYQCYSISSLRRSTGSAAEHVADGGATNRLPWQTAVSDAFDVGMIATPASSSKLRRIQPSPMSFSSRLQGCGSLRSASTRPPCQPSAMHPQLAMHQQSRNLSTRLFAMRGAVDDGGGGSDDGSHDQDKKKKKKKKGKGAINNPAQSYRADRVLSNRGWGTRSECFQILKAKRVTMRRGDTFERVPGPAHKIPLNASLWIDQKEEVEKPPPLIRIYHKPKWVLSVMRDEELQRPNLENLPFLQKGKLHPVGRLDYDTSGLLLFSSKGTLTQTLLHPNHEVEKEYAALVVGKVTHDVLKTRLLEGVNTTMGTFSADLIESSDVPEGEVQTLIADILNNLPPEYNVKKLEDEGHLDFRHAKELSRVRVVVREGKHRMVRRMLANAGHEVIGLKRERLGAIHLDDLPVGEYREMTQTEASWIDDVLNGKKKKKKSKSNVKAEAKVENTKDSHDSNKRPTDKSTRSQQPQSSQ